MVEGHDEVDPHLLVLDDLDALDEVADGLLLERGRHGVEARAKGLGEAPEQLGVAG